MTKITTKFGGFFTTIQALLLLSCFVAADYSTWEECAQYCETDTDCYSCDVQWGIEDPEGHVRLDGEELNE